MTTICEDAKQALEEIRALRWLQKTTRNTTHDAQNRILRSLDPIALTQVALGLRKEQEQENDHAQK
jgi:hypothetical protein